MKKLLVVIAAFILTACEPGPDTAPDKTSSGSYKVVGIKDGDTIELLKDGQTEIVRLAEIDCPEKAQAFGKRAKQFTAELCFGKYVKLRGDNKRDQYKRIVATIIIDDTLNLNSELLKAGYAWHFKRYSNNSEYALLEETARQQRIGLWAGPNPVAPWEWRKENHR